MGEFPRGDSDNAYLFRQDTARDKEGYSSNSKELSLKTIDQILGEQEVRKIIRGVFDESGKELCTIEYDPERREVVSITPKPYINIEGKAEHPNEKVYVTDENGSFTQERLTRAEAREQKKRYLIVTGLLLHGDDALTQKRSFDKEIEPGKISSSAHGVAKEVFYEDGSLVDDVKTASLINTALEMNEELRHGDEPFAVKVWPWTARELVEWAEENKINDPNTVWLVPLKFICDDGYPSGDWHNPRSRAISAGLIFSKDKPKISIDKNETEEYKWQRPVDIFKTPDVSEDLDPILAKALGEILKFSRYAERYGQQAVDNLLRRWQGFEPYEKP